MGPHHHHRPLSSVPRPSWPLPGLPPLVGEDLGPQGLHSLSSGTMLRQGCSTSERLGPAALPVLDALLSVLNRRWVLEQPRTADGSKVFVRSMAAGCNLKSRSYFNLSTSFPLLASPGCVRTLFVSGLAILSVFLVAGMMPTPAISISLVLPNPQHLRVRTFLPLSSGQSLW